MGLLKNSEADSLIKPLCTGSKPYPPPRPQHFGQGLHFQTPRFCIQRLHKEWVGEVGCLPLHIFIMNLFVVKSPNRGLVWFYFCPFSSSLMCTVYAGRSFLIQVGNLTYSADHFNLLDLAQTRLP